MKIIFRSNNHFAKKTLVGLGGAEAWLKSLSKYLSDDATICLSIFTDKKSFTEASLYIYDDKLHVTSKTKNEDMVDAVNSAIAKSAAQLKKAKDKKTNHSLTKNEKDILSFDDLEDEIDLNTNVLSGYEILDAEKALAERKNTSKYAQVTKKYVDYLYGVKDIENEIVKAEEHLAVLKHILATELDTMLYIDYVALQESIKQIETEIKALKNRKSSYKMNIRNEKYINECIDEELNVLRLKRK